MRRVRCEQVTLADGSVVLVCTRGRLTAQDRKAVEGFNQILKCFDCISREQCALEGMCLISSGVKTEEVNDAAQERPEQESDQ